MVKAPYDVERLLLAGSSDVSVLEHSIMKLTVSSPWMKTRLISLVSKPWIKTRLQDNIWYRIISGLG